MLANKGGDEAAEKDQIRVLQQRQHQLQLQQQEPQQ